MLEGFKKISVRSRRPRDGRFCASFSGCGIRLSSPLFRKMGSPEYVSAYINNETKCFALKADKKKTPDSYKIGRSKAGEHLPIPSRTLRALISSVSGWDFGSHTYRADATFDEVEGVAYFDLSKAEAVTKRSLHPKNSV